MEPTDYTPPSLESRSIWAAHVRLIKEMGEEDDAWNGRSCDVIRYASGRTDHAESDRSADPWLARAKAILDEERVARGLAPGGAS